MRRDPITSADVSEDHGVEMLAKIVVLTLALLFVGCFVLFFLGWL